MKIDIKTKDCIYIYINGYVYYPATIDDLNNYDYEMLYALSSYEIRALKDLKYQIDELVDLKDTIDSIIEMREENS